MSKGEITKAHVKAIGNILEYNSDEKRDYENQDHPANHIYVDLKKLYELGEILKKQLGMKYDN